MMKAISLNVTMNTVIMMMNNDKEDEHTEVKLQASKQALNFDNDGDDESIKLVD